MLNFTLTITAAPELLAAVSNFSNAITCAKVVTIPESNLDFTPVNVSKELAVAAVSYNQPNAVPVNTGNNQGNSGPAYPVQLAPTQGAAVPTSAQTYSMEQLAVAATQIVDAGRRTELVSLLNSFGVQALTALPKEHYGAFATQLRAAGAKL
jgi:hypothetical protein